MVGGRGEGGGEKGGGMCLVVVPCCIVSFFSLLSTEYILSILCSKSPGRSTLAGNKMK